MLKDPSSLNVSMQLASAASSYSSFPELSSYYAKKALEAAKEAFGDSELPDVSSEEQQNAELEAIEQSKVNDLPEDEIL